MGSLPDEVGEMFPEGVGELATKPLPRPLWNTKRASKITRVTANSTTIVINLFGFLFFC
jgi:hypothetical protein